MEQGYDYNCLAMREIERYLERLNAAYDGGSYGPGLRHNLASFPPGPVVLGHPLTRAHSPAEMALHIMSWMEVVIRRLAGEAISADEVDDFPSTEGQSWTIILERMERTQSRLCDMVARTSVEELDDPAPGTKGTIRELLEMVINHNLYHSGQLAILRKALPEQS